MTPVRPTRRTLLPLPLALVAPEALRAEPRNCAALGEEVRAEMAWP
jgi:hypothetical protein